MTSVGAYPDRGSLPPAGGLTIRALWELVVKHRLLVLGSILGAGVLATIVSLFITNQYTAVTIILPPLQNSSLSSSLSTQLGSIGSLGSIAGSQLGIKDPNDIYIGMLQSRVVEDALVRQFHLADIYHARKPSLARIALEKHSTILSTKNGYISVSVEDQDPNRSAEIANAYVEQLQELRSQFAATEAGQRRRFFDEQLQDTQGKLVASEQQLKETQQQTGVLQLDTQMRATIESVTQLKAQIAAKEVELQVISSYASGENPQRLLTEQEIVGLRRQLSLLENNDGRRKNDLQVTTSQIPAIGMTYLDQLREVRYYETISELLAKQLEAARLDEVRQGSTLQVLDKAVPPDTKSFPNRLMIAAVASFLGFFGSIVFLVAVGEQPK